MASGGDGDPGDGRFIAVVTGGAGFLGARIVDRLARSGRFSEVRLFDLNPPATPPQPVGDCRIVVIRGDLCSPKSLEAAFQHANVVVNTAALVSTGDVPYERLHAVNVVGTRNVMAACRTCKVKVLVHTATMDVVCGTDSEVLLGDEDELHYPDSYLYGDYARTKSMAEAEVLAANSSTLRTCSVRPCGMYGPGDPWIVGAVLDSARSGKLTMRIGSPKLQFQFVYVENCAHLHVCAALSLLDGTAAAGQAYIATDDTPPQNLWEFCRPIVKACGYKFPPAWPYVPFPVILVIAYLLQLLAWVISPFCKTKWLNPMMVAVFRHSHTFKGQKARDQLGYKPVVDLESALAETTRYWVNRDSEARAAKK
eukprot:m.38546 g.38546  ORF g.38546 m.38546 type:complete len:367 (+) comp11191_c0_seq2:2592-3692(+)